MRILLIATILSSSLFPATAADFELIVHQAGGGTGEVYVASPLFES